MNIDAFLHKTQASVEALHSLAVRVNNILKTDVYDNMNSIKAMTLFDSALATSRMWVSCFFLSVSTQRYIIYYFVCLF